MEQTQEQADSETIKTEEVFSEFAAGCDFFTERVDIPSGLKANELDTALLTQLEGMAPFSSDQLSWGAYVDREKNQALVYAALAGHLEGESRDEQKDAQKPRLPSFLPFLGYVAEKSCVLCGVCGDTLSLLVYDEPGALPKEVHSVSVENSEITPDLARRIRTDLLRDLSWINSPVEESVYFFDTLRWNWKREATMLSKESGAGVIEFTLDRQQIYLADTRPVPVKRKALTVSRLNLLLWLTTAGSLTTVVVLLLLSGVKMVWDSGINKQLAKVESQKEHVALIESKNRNLAMFESGAAARLQPLAMLDIVNRYRPDELFFSEVKAFEGNRMQIDGVAENDGTTLVNQFRDRLQAVDLINSSNIEISRISDGATYFKCTIEFNELELADVGAQGTES